VILRAAEGQDALETGRAAAVDDLRHLRRADEGDALDAGMVADRLDRLLSAVDDVQHTVRQARFREQLGDAAGRDGNELARLEDHAIAEGEGVGDRPVWDHVREVEGRDRRDDADGIALDAALHTAGDLEHFAGRDLRQRAGELRQLRRLQHLRARLAVDLPVLFRHELRQPIDVLFQQRLVAEEDLHALLDRRRRPGREGRLRRLHRAIDIPCRRQRHAREHAAIRGIVHVELRRLAVDELAGDVVADVGVFRRRGGFDGGHGLRSLSRARGGGRKGARDQIARSGKLPST
jgi:hypothetical protein